MATAKLIARVWETKRVPQDWTDAILVPLFKKGEKTKGGNYRGIGLNDIAAKIFVLVLLKSLPKRERLADQAEPSGIPSEEKGVSTRYLPSEEGWNTNAATNSLQRYASSTSKQRLTQSIVKHCGRS